MVEDTVPGAAHRTVSRGLLGTLRGFLYATAATAFGAAIASVNWARTVDGVIVGTITDPDRLLQAEEMGDGLLGLFALSALVVGVLSIIWWYQAYAAIERTGMAGRSWSAGWAVGGWFIPIANLIIPKLVLNEIDRVSGAADDGSAEWRDRPLHFPATLWWATFVAGSLLIAVGTGITADQVERLIPNPELYRSGIWITGAGLAVDVFAALFGAASLRVIGARVSR